MLQNTPEAGEEGALKYTWCWIQQCGSFLVVNYIFPCVYVRIFMHVCAPKWWVCGRNLKLFSKGTIASDRLAEKAIHQSNGGNYGFVSSGGAVLVYSKGSWWKYQHNIDYYKLIIILIIINEKKRIENGQQEEIYLVRQVTSNEKSKLF